MKTQVTKNLVRLAENLPSSIAVLSDRQTDIADKMTRLEEQGLIYANEHWREGKYMYLLFPLQTGQSRRRMYVGKDPQKIIDAQSAIKRAKAFDELKQRMNDLEKIAAESVQKLQDTLKLLSKI